MPHGPMLADKTMVDDMQLRLDTLLVAMKSLGRLFPVSGESRCAGEDRRGTGR